MGTGVTFESRPQVECHNSQVHGLMSSSSQDIGLFLFEDGGVQKGTISRRQK